MHYHQSYVQHYIANLILVQCVIASHAEVLTEVGSTSLVDLLWGFFCLVFVMPLCSSVYMCLVVTCWERADLLALVFGV